MTPLEATDHLGVIHRVLAGDRRGRDRRPWPPDRAQAAVHRRRPPPLRNRLQLPASRSTIPGCLRPDHPANYVLMMFVAMEDPGLVVLPTHRLFRGLPAMTAEELAARLGDCFTHAAGRRRPATRPTAVWDDIETGRRPGHARPLHPRRTSAGRIADDHRRRPGQDGRGGRRP